VNQKLQRSHHMTLALARLFAHVESCISRGMSLIASFLVRDIHLHPAETLIRFRPTRRITRGPCCSTTLPGTAKRLPKASVRVGLRIFAAGT
jgi:hypothetical protein